MKNRKNKIKSNSRDKGQKLWKKAESIILNDGLYSLVEVTKEMMYGIEIISKVTCFDLCDGCAEQVPDDTGNIPTPESCYEIFNSSNSEIPFPYYKEHKFLHHN